VKNQISTEGEVVENPVIVRDELTETESDLSANLKKLRKKTTALVVETSNFGTETGAQSFSSSGTTIGKHNRDECLMCSRSKLISKILETTSLNIQEPKDLASQNGGKIRDSDVSFYSPESVISDDSANTNMPDRISNTILRNIIKMANPIMFKACRKILMELKQKYPQSFQDICLYSEICKHMSKCSYRMSVRRFIQEIFFDLNFDCFLNGVEAILEVAQHRVNDLSLLDTSKLLPSSPSMQSSTSSVPHPSPSISIPLHKLHSLKSPLLASVYETSVENLVDSPPKFTKDEVDAIVMLRSPEKGGRASPSGSTKVTVEVHHSLNRRSLESSEGLQPLRRRRFNTLELDLSCTKNKFPIKHRSPPSTSGPNTLFRPVSLNVKDQQQPLQKSIISTSDHSFEASTRRISSPVSTPLGPLFCEQRLLTSSRSEATLSNKRSDGKKVDNTISKK
jgi:rapamycin-insensitive companion of mTOR